MQQTFLDLIYKIFYDTAKRDFKDVRLLLSEKYFFPSIEYEPNIEVKIPLPKGNDNGMVYCGYLFGDSAEELNSAWGLFLASVYHMAAHVAVSNYSLYEEWKKNKTPKKFWRVIDFIEDDAVERYLSSTNPDAWENISRITKEYAIFTKNQKKKSFLGDKMGSGRVNLIKNEMSDEPFQSLSIQHKDNILSWANQLYKSHSILLDETPLFYESHNHHQLLLLRKNNKPILPHGKF